MPSKLCLRLCSRSSFAAVITLIIFISFIVGMIRGLGIPQTIMPVHLGFLELLKHNSYLLLISIVIGLVSLGVGSLILPCYTMFNLGLIIPGIVAGYGWHPLVMGVLPHAFFEIASFIIGVLISFEVYRMLLMYQLRLPCNIRKTILQDAYLFTVSLLLMMIAAFVESGVSYV